MRHYKYKQNKTEGLTGTQITHKTDEENVVYVLGEIDEYTYIQTDGLESQPEELEFIEVTLTDEEIEELSKQKHLKSAKLQARKSIRELKDFEDDLTDLKKVVQFMARGFAGLWKSLPDDVKNNNPYKENFDLFSTTIMTSEIRIDLEKNQAEKVNKILQDEETYAKIVHKSYLNRL